MKIVLDKPEPWRGWYDDDASVTWHDGFSRRVQPGWLVWVQGEDEPTLIGHINELGGGCDCCSVLGHATMIVAYEVVWEPSK